MSEQSSIIWTFTCIIVVAAIFCITYNLALVITLSMMMWVVLVYFFGNPSYWCRVAKDACPQSTIRKCRALKLRDVESPCLRATEIKILRGELKQDIRIPP
jgi:hypothetical protein